MPTLTTMISLRAPEGSQGRYQSLLSLAFGVGFVAGPALGAQIYERCSGTALWLGTGAAAAAVSAIFLLQGREAAGAAGEGRR